MRLTFLVTFVGRGSQFVSTHYRRMRNSPGTWGAAFAVCVSAATAISEVNARAAINILMTHLHVVEHCPFRRIKMTIALSLPVMVR